MTPILWFVSCSVACLFGYIVGRCFRDFEGIAATQDLIYYENDNESLRGVLNQTQSALAHALACMKQMQADLEAVGGKSKEAEHVA